MKKLLSALLGDPNKKEIAKHQAKITEINQLSEEFKAMSDEALASKTAELKEQLTGGKSLDDVLPPAFAAVREALDRKLEKRHFDVQLIGGAVLHEGKISEMKTGEGKTFVASLAAYLNALSGEGVHLVTVNDYLARRDAGWLGPVYHALGTSVGVIIQDASYVYDPEFSDPNALDDRLKNLKPVTRKEAYAADITYGTNNEFGFDYLRDNMATGLEGCVQRRLNFAIVDEVDSILIDEARTPLIISGQASESTDEYYQFAQIVRQLSETEHYVTDEKLRTATINDAGIKKVENLLGVDNLYIEGGTRSVHHLEQALRANALFKKDKDYVVKEGEVIIVDEFTGRLMHGRRYSEGLHQAIEAKEGVEVKRESMTLATISFQNFFRMYKKLSGMTGTAATEAEEFNKIYGLDVVVVPTHRPLIRKDVNDRIYKNEEGKFNAIISEVIERTKAGQPVLLGTISIEKNEIISEMLMRRGVQHEVLNAKNHEKEALIIAQAGAPGAVTVATNMAGRGVDIILGGEPYDETKHKRVTEAGGLHVIGSERHESRRIDNQLRGRAGRQGDPGSSQFFVSLEDDLMRIFGGDRVKRMMEAFGLPEDTPIENPIINKSLESAQRRVEGNNFDIRKHLVEYDDVMNRHRQHIYKKRREILDEADMKLEILKMVDTEVSSIVDAHTQGSEEEWNREAIIKTLSGIMEISTSTKDEISKLDVEGMKDHLFDSISAAYEEREKKLGSDSARLLERLVYLRAIDSLWIEHIDAMEHMRQGIGLRGYAQKDPLVEYKHESHRMFNELNSAIDAEVVFSIMKVSITEQASEVAPQTVVGELPVTTSRGKMVSSAGEVKEEEPEVEQVVKTGPQVGRNEPCFCGSGRKYKKCGMINSSEHQKNLSEKGIA